MSNYITIQKVNYTSIGHLTGGNFSSVFASVGGMEKWVNIRILNHYYIELLGIKFVNFRSQSGNGYIFK